MRLKKYLYLLCFGAMVSCADLDIPPKNILGDKDVFSSADGVMAMLARMYSTMPIEDFRYTHQDHSGLFNFNGTMYKQQACLTGEAIGRDTKGAEAEHASYWDGAYKAIREANIMLEALPEYASNHSVADFNSFMGEARFIRAYIYYSLAKRYGGVPLVDKVINYPDDVDIEGTKLFRASEEATWDFIAADLDFAIANLRTTKSKGRINKAGAAAFKSRVMLHAGSIAKYNTVNEVYNNVRICGIPATRANDYFKAAYEASKLVTGYSLYKGEWKAGDKAAQALNFPNIFTSENAEIIFGRYYKDPDSYHQFDNSAHTMQTSTGGNNSELCPTVDFIEMFEGVELNDKGKFQSFDENGKYKLYNSPLDAFVDCEPRLRGTVVLPMDQLMNQTIDMRRGIWIGSADGGIDPLLSEGYIGGYASVYPESSNLKLSTDFSANNADKNAITLKDGSKMKRAGASGIVTNWDFGNISGINIRKYIDPTRITNNHEKSVQTWIDIRFAEVLLNRAEAAYELYQAGETTAASGEDYREEAFKCINQIRERAGATELASAGDLNSIDIVRKERRKELAFENKTYWDLKRWRIIYDEQNNTRWRTLNAFFSTDAEKYFLDVTFQEPRSGLTYIYTFDTKQYYQQIPTAETTKNPNCKQNPGY